MGACEYARMCMQLKRFGSSSAQGDAGATHTKVWRSGVYMSSTWLTELRCMLPEV